MTTVNELTEMVNKVKYFIYVKDEQALWCILERTGEGASGYVMRLKFAIGEGDYLEANEFYAAHDVILKQIEKYPETFTKEQNTALGYLGDCSKCSLPLYDAFTRTIHDVQSCGKGKRRKVDLCCMEEPQGQVTAYSHRKAKTRGKL